MLTRTYVNLRYWFYPTGNTPAVDLLRNVHLSKGGHVDILSLGCGDVRNMLFTLWSQGAVCIDTTINITVYDMDPAILARNVFLLSFSIKHQAEFDASTTLQSELLDTLWSMYYRLFLTRKALDVLQKHAFELAEPSSSLEKWRSSPYGNVLSFVNKTTLTEMSSFWQRYANASGGLAAGDYEKEVRKTIKDIITEHIGNDTPMAGFRSAGAHGLKSIPVFIKCFRKYWTTGVVAGNRKDCEAIQADHGGAVNPLLAFSSAPNDKFYVQKMYSAGITRDVHAVGMDGSPIKTWRMRINTPILYQTIRRRGSFIT